VNTHAQDFDTLLNLDELQELVMTNDSFIRTGIIETVYGGTDENQRYEKCIHFAIQYFKEYNINRLFITTNIPGRIAFNRV